jgi:serine/threonine protein phosphatase 1
MGRRLIVGDIHGAFMALMDVLHKADFNPQTDTLFAVGDYVDGWPESYRVVKYLKELPNFKGVIGNHDFWAADWLYGQRAEHIWITQGGEATMKSYQGVPEEEKREHAQFLYSLPTYIVDNNMLICHGGTITTENLSHVDEVRDFTLIWDRDLFRYFVMASAFRRDVSVKPFSKVFIGHTQTENMNMPFIYNGLWNIDQGAGWNGKLTLVDMDSNDWWQSDRSSVSYPKIKGRF